MKRNDLVLIAFLLAASILSMFVISLINKDDTSKVAVISVDGIEADRIPLNSSEQERRVSFEFAGNIGYIAIKSNAVKMEEMDRRLCPEKICSEKGWISKSYETIVCLPNKIVVSIENSEGNPEADSPVDQVSY